MMSTVRGGKNRRTHVALAGTFPPLTGNINTAVSLKICDVKF